MIYQCVQSVEATGSRGQRLSIGSESRNDTSKRSGSQKARLSFTNHIPFYSGEYKACCGVVRKQQRNSRKKNLNVPERSKICHLRHLY